MRKTNNEFRSLIVCILIFLAFSCGVFLPDATEEENKAIKKVIKDGNFLISNYFEKSDVSVVDSDEAVEYSISVRADEEYDYNTVKVRIAKKPKGYFYDVSYSIALSQDKGEVRLYGKIITEESPNEFFSDSVVKKLVSNTDQFEKVYFNKKRYYPKSISMNIF